MIYVRGVIEFSVWRGHAKGSSRGRVKKGRPGDLTLVFSSMMMGYAAHNRAERRLLSAHHQTAEVINSFIPIQLVRWLRILL